MNRGLREGLANDPQKTYCTAAGGRHDTKHSKLKQLDDGMRVVSKTIRPALLLLQGLQGSMKKRLGSKAGRTQTHTDSILLIGRGAGQAGKDCESGKALAGPQALRMLIQLGACMDSKGGFHPGRQAPRMPSSSLL